MKYLNHESQFTRVSDEHARALMESAGYEIPSEEQVHIDVYGYEDYRFALSEEVVEAEDGYNYIRLEELDESFSIALDESGDEILIESVEFDDVSYILEGVYEGEDGNLYACMVSEQEVDEAYKAMKEEDEGDDEEAEDKNGGKEDIADRLKKAKAKAKKKGGMDKKDKEDC